MPRVKTCSALPSVPCQYVLNQLGGIQKGFNSLVVLIQTGCLRINGVETYLESPLPRLREAGWRIVWFFTISTTHLVFNSFSVEQKHEFYKEISPTTMKTYNHYHHQKTVPSWKET